MPVPGGTQGSGVGVQGVVQSSGKPSNVGGVVGVGVGQGGVGSVGGGGGVQLQQQQQQAMYRNMAMGGIGVGGQGLGGQKFQMATEVSRAEGA